MNEAQEAAALETILAALPDDATEAQIIQATNGYNPSAVSAALVGLGAAGGGGGLAVMEDPGAWQANHAYAEGDRFSGTVDGELRVFEITVAGTSGGGVFSDYEPFDLVPGPDNTWGTNNESFIYIGIVGQISWHEAPFLGGGLEVGPLEDNGHPLFYTTEAGPGGSENMFAIRATVDDFPVPVFEMKTDGDGDYALDVNAGAALRFNATDDGALTPGARFEISYEGFRAYLSTGGQEMRVRFSPFAVRFIGLPTVDPASAGQLWNDGGTLKVSAG